MLDDLTPAQRELADFMSAISEEVCSAGWMVELEYVLWDALTDGRSVRGSLQLRGNERAELRRLCDACSGWVFFDERSGETWLPIGEWERRFVAWKKRQPALPRSDT